MKNNLLLASLGAGLILARSAAAQSVLFTTADDFTGWSGGGFTDTASTATDLDGSSVNGLGNPSAAGATGTAGSLSMQWTSGTYDYAAYSPGEQGNAAFLSALENGTSLTFDYTTPPPGAGNYFGLGIVVNYAGGFDQLFPSSTTSLGGGVTQATVDWSTEAATSARTFSTAFASAQQSLPFASRTADDIDHRFSGSNRQLQAKK